MKSLIRAVRCTLGKEFPNYTCDITIRYITWLSNQYTILDVPMVVDSTGIYEMKGLDYMLTIINWFLQKLFSDT